MATNAQGTRSRAAKPRQFVTFDENTAATHDVIAAPGASLRIVVMGIHLSAAGTVTATINSDLAAGTPAAIMARPMIAGSSIDAESESGLCACDTNKGLSINLSAAVQVAGVISYVIEDALA